MIDKKLLNFSTGYLKNTLFRGLYSGFGINICKPATISVLLTWRCNSRCPMCDYWHREKRDELSMEHWLKFLTELKKWHKNAHVQFSGGEPFVRKNAIEIFEHCNRINLSYGITTNLTALPGRLIERLVAAHPFNINISLDGIRPETHDQSRGVPGSFIKVMGNIDKILDEMSKRNKKCRIIIKTTVMSININECEEIVKFVKEKGLTGINFQPVFKWSGSSAEDFWITDLGKIDEVSHRLIDMKSDGYPILSSKQDLLNWKSHFKEELLQEKNHGKCLVGVKNFDVLPNGDVFLCRTINCKIGNVVEGMPSRMWHSKTASRERERILKCQKLCLATCLTKRGMKDLLSAFMKMSKSG